MKQLFKIIIVGCLINLSLINKPVKCETVLPNNLKEISKYKSLCQVKLLLGDFSKAKENCHKVLEIKPNDNETINLIGKITEGENLYNKISEKDNIEIYKKILEISPFNRKILIELGFQFIEKDNNAAKEYLIRSFQLGIDNDNQDGYQSIAVLYTSENDFEKTIFYYDKALNVSNDSSLDALIYHKRGDIYFEKGAYIMAKEDFKQAIKLFPENDFAIEDLGIVYYFEKNYQQAIKYLKQSIKLNEKIIGGIHDDLPYFYLGEIYSIQKNPTKAIINYKKGCELKNQESCQKLKNYQVRQ